MNPSLAQKAESLPAQPGVYLFRDAQERPIYVGKAGSLRQRVRSYFQDSRSQDVKRDAMLEAAEDLEWIVVDSDAEAFVLENNLIKQFKPRYNVLLRDDKTYPYVKLTVAERFPRVYVTRRLKKDGS
ncbi:MAG: GIY-YIG nuclease family protein, partial [Terriglobia bacterium]